MKKIFSILFSTLGFLANVIGSLFYSGFTALIGGSGLYYLYQTIIGENIPMLFLDDVMPLNLFMTTELGILPNPIALCINLLFVWWGYLLIKFTFWDFLDKFFNRVPKEKEQPSGPSKIKTILKYFFWYIVMIGLYAFATLIVYGIIIIGPITFIDWAFDVNLAYKLEYYFETIFVSGSEAFRYLKFWLIGIPFAYLFNIKDTGWKIKNF